VKKSRAATGLSQIESAELISVSRRAWQTYEDGTVPMKVGLWELYQFKTGQIWVRPLPLKAAKRATLRQGRQENLKPFKAKSQE
jgi:predicted transcriptional regulator